MKKHGFLYELKKNKVLFLMAMPSVLLTFFLAYLTMSGLVLALKTTATTAAFSAATGTGSIISPTCFNPARAG